MAGGAAARQGKRQGDFLAGKYLLEDCLGIGGMGEVYRATNVSLGRKVAIKLLSSEFVNNEDDVNRFLREARAAAAVRHANVVDVLDVSREEDGTPFIVQELLAGEDLERYLKSRGGRISPGEALELMIPVADAVGAAHAQNVVHRDLKPANIFLSRDRNNIVPKVLDFGAALFPTIAERSAKEARMLIGTPHYMAPEQIVDKSAVDARSDVWALGVILYEMMVGETPFEAETAQAVLAKVKAVNVPLLRSRVKDAAVDLEQVVAKCTQRDRTARYPDANAVRDALEAVRRKLKGGPAPANIATLDDVAAPLPMPRPGAPRPVSEPKIAAPSAPRIGAPSAPRIAAPSAPRIGAPSAPRIGVPSAPRSAPKPPPPSVPSLDQLDIPLPTEPTPLPVDEPREFDITSPDEPDDDIPLRPKLDSLDLDLPLPELALPELPLPQKPPARAVEAAPRMAPSGVRDKVEPPKNSLDLPPFSADEDEGTSAPSSLPPVLFSASAVQKKPAGLHLPPAAPVPQFEPLQPLPLDKARPVGPAAVKPTDYAKRIVEQTWSRSDSFRLGFLVALPAIAGFLIAGLVPPISQPVRHALLGDSLVASGILAVTLLLATAGLCARAALRERTRLAWVAAAASLVFGIAMIITTLSAGETAEAGNASTTSLATLIGPLLPAVLALDWLTKARDFWLDPYSRTEARRSALVASLFLFLTLAFSPFGAVRAPARPMNAIQAMLK